MTSSQTYNFSNTFSIADSIIGAYERIQIRAPELRQEHWVTARREINLLFSEMSNRQVNLFSVRFGNSAGVGIDMVQGQAVYDIPDEVVMILDAYISLNNGTDNQTDRYLTPMSRTQYASIANKATQGPPTTYWFDRLINSQIYMWPTPDGGGPYVLNYYAAVQLEDASVASGQTPSVPYRWLDVVVSGIAARLAKVYQPTQAESLHAAYERAWTIAAAQDTENVPLTVALNVGGYYPR